MLYKTKAWLTAVQTVLGVLGKKNPRTVRAVKARFHPRITTLLLKKKFHCLELCRLWCTRERNDVTDVLHSGHEQDETLETETESAVRA